MGDREALSLWVPPPSNPVMFSKMIQAMKNFFLGVSLITLALGGIGVMNIMLVAVRERTRDRCTKALGATPKIIHRQFIVEGLGLTLLSGMLGFVGGIGLCKLINMLPMPARFSGMIVTPGTSMIAVLALAIVGILAALYPAAARRRSRRWNRCDTRHSRCDSSVKSSRRPSAP